MSRGGKRENAGRPKGSENKTTKAFNEAGEPLTEKCLPKAIGICLEYLESLDNKKKETGVDMLVKLLPYFRPRLQSTELKANDDGKITVVYESEPIPTDTDSGESPKGS